MYHSVSKIDDPNILNKLFHSSMATITLVFLFSVIHWTFLLRMLLLINYDENTGISLFARHSAISTTLNQILETKNVCYIFDEGVKYQVLISLGSILLFNAKDTFTFYFILPQKTTLDLTPYKTLLNSGSQIIIKHYEPRHAYLKNYTEKKCRWSNIIIVKFRLHEILPELDKVLYLDSDTICLRPIRSFWEINLQYKNFAGTTLMEDPNSRWINSGVILYNLKELRRKPKSLWECAARTKKCFVDDIWHLRCHGKSRIYQLPMRYNLNLAFLARKSPTKSFEREKWNPIIVHLMGQSHKLYTIKSVDQCRTIKPFRNMTSAIRFGEKLFFIRKTIDQIAQS